jgi:hypothetical protein
MASATPIHLTVVRKYKGFKDIKTLVNVGGGIGKALKTIISSYPTFMGSIMIFLMSLPMHPPCLVTEISFVLSWVLCILQQKKVMISEYSVTIFQQE